MINEIPKDDLGLEPLVLTEEEENELVSGPPDLTGEELKKFIKVEEGNVLTEDDFI